eukprot:2325608-Pyramimonas_sp.AAC.1
MILHWRWQRPARPEWSADLALVHVVVLRPLCRGPEIARRSELPWVRPPDVSLLVSLGPVLPPEE